MRHAGIKKILTAGIVFSVIIVLFLFIIISSLAAELGVEEAAGDQSGNETEEEYEGGYKGGKFVFPAPSYTAVTSEQGWRVHPISGVLKYHSGMDLGAPSGTAILAAAPGKVTLASWNGGYGNCVIIDHGGGISTLYGHASALYVSKGQTVSAGKKIAAVGSTGWSTGPHLHFEVIINGEVTDPRPYIFGNKK